MFNKNKYSITIIVFSILLFVYSSFSQNSTTKNVVDYRKQRIQIHKSNRQLVTGIDVEKVMQRYISDYEAFEISKSGISMGGLTFRWRVKPDSTDPETRYFWGKKRSLPYYCRYVRLDIGIFRSHHDAVQAAVRTLSTFQMLPSCNPIDPEEPGFVSWGNDIFVRDNVYILLLVHDLLNPAEIRRRFDQDLKNGAEGIQKGDVVNPPIIHGEDFPSEFAFWIQKKATAQLFVSDPNQYETYPFIWVSDFEFPKIERLPDGTQITFPRINPPAVKWIGDNRIEIYHQDKDDRVTLSAVAVNEMCVVSDLWEKKVEISVSVP